MKIRPPYQIPQDGEHINWGHWMMKGLVGWWKFDETTAIHGSTLADSSGNGNTGTLSTGDGSTEKSVAGKLGKGVSFDGVDDYVDAGDSNNWKFGTENFSVSFWMKANAWSGYAALLSNGNYTTDWDGFQFSQEDSDIGVGRNYNGIRFDIAGTSEVELDSTTDIAVGSWYHIVGVRSGTTGYIYVNGVFERSRAGFGGNVTVARSLMIGKNPDTTYPRNFNGLIDDVRIYNRALSASEVAQMYNNPMAMYEKMQLPLPPFNATYTRGNENVLPADDTDLETDFSATEYVGVSSDDDVYVSQTATGENVIFLWKDKYISNHRAPTATWKGKTNRAPTLSVVYLQIYNQDTSTWETLDSNNIAGADEEFTLSGAKTTGVAKYYDANNVVSCRVYQDAV